MLKDLYTYYLSNYHIVKNEQNLTLLWLWLLSSTVQNSTNNSHAGCYKI